MSYDCELRQRAEQAVDMYFENVKQDPYFPGYHLAPPSGLLNDPNGWIQWKGRYHLFFQWMPFHTGHGAKFWGHFSSRDLVNWRYEPIALTPADWFDKSGCYSGSAVNADGMLKVFYTGNVKDEQGNRETYQCLAESADGFHFEKKGVKVRLPEGYTPHFRDPKVWKHEDQWYMVIGAQKLDKKGCAVLLKSAGLEDWTCIGVLSHANAEPLENLGYMWECPDLFSLNERDVLLFSPQGLEADGIDYNNHYQSGYVIGTVDYETAAYKHGKFLELDRGFEFYAPQTTLDDNGRRILIGWMGVPDQNEAEQPTVPNGWVHQMTLPRKLELRNDKILQHPLDEMKLLRIGEAIDRQFDRKYQTSISKTSEIDINGDIESLNIFGYADLYFNQAEGVLTLERPSYVNGIKETRSCCLPSGLNRLHIFVDHSSLEIFVNDGEEVFTSRMFAPNGNDSLTINTNKSSHVQIWDLKNDTIHIR
ncbi:sucrose-6-phosphate hydrolase [Halobacillus sp. A5]|uniref:sucrose-6-phosphate hydrolase n=1 Tax=Halobacillus sp. A5 TaxID=2880263 RepID=UPI0020A69E92|nr:sucrose-6-phosphate hydrolase [Halobacillus sp. A5]MCP3028002.1 sucrose-6-phosphate hydrolase [Halobacillus sp. A5]